MYESQFHGLADIRKIGRQPGHHSYIIIDNENDIWIAPLSNLEITLRFSSIWTVDFYGDLVKIGKIGKLEAVLAKC